MKKQLLVMAQNRGDDWGLEVIGRLQIINDLVAEEAMIHKACRSTFDYKRQHSVAGRPPDIGKLNVYKKFSTWFREGEIVGVLRGEKVPFAALRLTMLKIFL